MPRRVFMFRPEFAPLVEGGSKSTTIRPKSKRVIRPGDIADCRAWTGLPYRSKQRKLREAVLATVLPISIYVDHDHAIIILDGRPLYADEALGLALGDGFKDVPTFIAFFERTHGLPFVGELFRWKA